MNKKVEILEKKVEAARRSGSREKQEKVKNRAKYDAKKEDKKKKLEDNEVLVPEAPKKWKDYSVKFQFTNPSTAPQSYLLKLNDLTFQYPNREDFRLSVAKNITVEMGTRVAIVGANGTGKSTLLNLLAGDLVPRSPNLRVGRYSQHFVDVLTMEETPVDYLLRLYGPMEEKVVRAQLGKFGLPGHNHCTPIVKLSGGQKARVVFSSISMSKPHILLLDEPTNHLDMQSIDALANALDEFTGSVVLVSHDSRLISKVCKERSQIWDVDNGSVKTFKGTFEDYKKKLQEEIAAELDGSK